MAISYRSVLRLHDLKYKNAEIARMLFTTDKTVKRIVDKATVAGVLNAKWEPYTDQQLKTLLNPRPSSRKNFYAADWKSIHEDLTRRSTSCSAGNHMTLQYAYEEYSKDAYQHHEDPMSRSKFYEDYALWWKKNDCASNIHWPAGRRMEIDFAGDILYYRDPENPEKKIKAVFFVCCLSHSRYTYAEAIPSQEMQYFLHGVIHACKYFGATAQLWVPDCTKAAVIKGSKTDWAVLNNSMRDLSEIYHVETVPCSPYTPKGVEGKGAVEATVNHSYQRIYNQIRNMTFYSLEELNEAIWAALEDFNNRPFEDKPEWTRKKAYFEKERQFMLPLPSDDFELRQTTTAKVRKHYVYCDLDTYYYSIPHGLKEDKVIIKLGMHDVLITSMTNELIATHVRGTDLWDKNVTIPEHLESYKRVYTDESPTYFIQMAENKAGAGTRLVVENILATTKYPETVYKIIRSVLGLGKRFGYENLEKACTAALKRYGTNPEARIAYAKLLPIVKDFNMQAKEERLRNLIITPADDHVDMDAFEV